MKFFRTLMRVLRTTTFLSMCLLWALPLKAEPKKPEAVSPDQQAIESIIKRIPSAVLNREVDTLVSFLKDSVEVTIYGRKAKGRENIRNLLNVGLTRFIDVKVETKTQEMKITGHRAAQLGYFKYTIEWPMGGTTVREGDFVAQWEQVKSSWLLSSLVVVPPKPADPEPKDQ
jgi:ketosteroid isomerase-like protein